MPRKRKMTRSSRFIRSPLYELVTLAGGTAAVCSRLKGRSNETQSGFAAPCGGDGVVATDDGEECRWCITVGLFRIGAAVNESGKVKRLDKGLAAVLRSSPARSH